MLLQRTQAQFLGSLEEMLYKLPHFTGKGVHPEAQPDGLEKAVTWLTLSQDCSAGGLS